MFCISLGYVISKCCCSHKDSLYHCMFSAKVDIRESRRDGQVVAFCQSLELPLFQSWVVELCHKFLDYFLAPTSVSHKCSMVWVTRLAVFSVFDAVQGCYIWFFSYPVVVILGYFFSECRRHAVSQNIPGFLSVLFEMNGQITRVTNELCRSIPASSVQYPQLKYSSVWPRMSFVCSLPLFAHWCVFFSLLHVPHLETEAELVIWLLCASCIIVVVQSSDCG